MSFDDRPITCNAAVTPGIAFDGVFLIPSAQVIARVIAEVFLKLVGPLLLNSLHDDSVNSLARATWIFRFRVYRIVNWSQRNFRRYFNSKAIHH